MAGFPPATATKIGTPPITISGTPSVGEVLTATSASAADWAAAGGGGAVVLIASVVLAAPAASIGFSAIAATYNHLRLVISSLRSSEAGSETDGFLVTLNGLTSAIYDESGMLVVGNVAPALYQARAQANWSGAGNFAIPAASATATVFGSYIFDLPGYANSNEKTMLMTGGYDDAAGTFSNFAIFQGQGKLRSTAAINAISLVPANGPNFIAGSAAYLYGIT
jgi:hypothetical protein